MCLFTLAAIIMAHGREGIQSTSVCTYVVVVARAEDAFEVSDVGDCAFDNGELEGEERGRGVSTDI